MTAQGPQMAKAMLLGHKPVETRNVQWGAGWYNLHCGKDELPNAYAEVLRQSWPDAPPEGDLPRSCIVGQVRLGRIAHCGSVNIPWALATAGKWSHVIEHTREFRRPILNVKGYRGPWRLKDPAVLERLQFEVENATFRDFSHVLPEIRDERRVTRNSRA